MAAASPPSATPSSPASTSWSAPPSTAKWNGTDRTANRFSYRGRTPSRTYVRYRHVGCTCDPSDRHRRPGARRAGPAGRPRRRNRMKVSVLGATRRTGRLVVDELLRRGHAVVALGWDPAGGALPDRVQVHAGHARDAATLQALVSGSDPDRTLVRPSRPVDTPGT